MRIRFTSRAAMAVGIILLCIVVFGVVGLATQVTRSKQELVPLLNNGAKWRIGYVESGQLGNYVDTLQGLIQGLVKLGWLNKLDGLPYTKGQKDTAVMWQWLARQDVGPYIEFVGDAYYTFEGSEGAGRLAVQQTVLKRLNEQKDIDLLIVMGTVAGQQLANDSHRVPSLVFSTSNAVQAGILQSVESSGRQYIWGHMDPGRYRRQIEIFHDIFQFKKLGVVYDDTVVGRTFSAIDDVEAVAKERGFTVARKLVADRQHDKQQFFAATLAAHKELAEQVDAVYISLYADRDTSMLPELLEPFYELNIPVFSQQGTLEVKHGALLSVGRANFAGIGQFGAETIVKALKGQGLQGLPQVYENTPSIVLNLEAADRIGYKPNFDILLVADEIHLKIARSRQ